MNREAAGFQNKLERKLKGKIAEDIVEMIFLLSGKKIFRFGVEHFFPLIGQAGRKFDPDLDPVLDFPDFVLASPSGVEFIEVKYRKEGRFWLKREPGKENDADKLDRYRAFPSPPTIFMISTLPEDNERYDFQSIACPYEHDESGVPIKSIPVLDKSEWGLDFAVCETYAQIAHQIFSAF